MGCERRSLRFFDGCPARTRRSPPGVLHSLPEAGLPFSAQSGDVLDYGSPNKPDGLPQRAACCRAGPVCLPLALASMRPGMNWERVG